MACDIQNKVPLVSICCITYNHAPFIRQSLEGMLMQQGVDFEILIHDDCSTDGTTEIVKEYAEKYPDIIFPLYESENQYLKIGAAGIDMFNYRRVRGKYVAYCEGDDYWTDPQKLQKQVDFMDSNPEYSICFHEFTTINIITGEQYVSQYPYDGDFDVTHQSVINCLYNVAQPLTMLFRWDCFDFEWQKHYTFYRDTVENFHILKAGKGRFLRFNGGVYNLQSTGISSTMTNKERAMITLPTYIEMYHYTKELFLIERIKETALWSLSVFDAKGNSKERVKIYMMLFRTGFCIGIDVMMTKFKRCIKRLLLH